MRSITITYTAEACSIGKCSFCIEKDGMGHCDDWIACSFREDYDKTIEYEDNCRGKFPDWCPMQEVVEPGIGTKVRLK